MKLLKRKSLSKLCGLMALVLVMGVLTACGSGTKSPGTDGTTQKPTTQGTQKATEPAEPEKPFKFSLMSRYFGNDFPDTNNSVFKKLQEITNTEIEWELVPSASYTEKLDVMIATNSLPMVTNIYNRKAANVVNAVEAGNFWIAGDYINPQDFPNLANNLRQSTIDACMVNGKYVFINAERNIGRQLILYRKDLAEKQGITKAPETIDEVYALFKALKNEVQFGFGAFEVTVPGEWNYMTAFSVWFGAPYQYGVENGKIVYAPTTKGWKDALKFTKRLYDEGIINKDFPTLKDKTTNEFFLAGKAGAVFSAETNITSFASQMTVDKFELDGFGAIDGGFGKKALNGAGNGQHVAISKSAVKNEEDLKKIIKFFNDISTSENQSLLGFGITGEHNEWVEEGKTIKKISDTTFLDKTSGVTNQIILHVNKLGFIPGEAENPRQIELRKENSAPGVGVLNVCEAFTSQTYSQLGPQLDNIIVDASVKFIYGEISEADFDKEIEKWMNAGGDKVLKDYQDQYDLVKK